jgi:hypothetical protein
MPPRASTKGISGHADCYLAGNLGWLPRQAWHLCWHRVYFIVFCSNAGMTPHTRIPAPVAGAA